MSDSLSGESGYLFNHLDPLLFNRPPSALGIAEGLIHPRTLLKHNSFLGPLLASVSQAWPPVCLHPAGYHFRPSLLLILSDFPESLFFPLEENLFWDRLFLAENVYEPQNVLNVLLMSWTAHSLWLLLFLFPGMVSLKIPLLHIMLFWEYSRFPPLLGRDLWV